MLSIKGDDTLPRKKQQDVEATPHPDGMREGVMNDPKGVQIGMNIEADQEINPAEIAKISNRSIKEMNDDKQQSNH